MRLQRLAGDTRTFDIVIDREIDAELPPAYLHETTEATDSLDRMTSLVEGGRLALWAAQHDWNTDSPQDVQRLRAQYDNDDQAARHLHVARQAGHSLHLPRLYNASREERLAAQQRNIASMAQAGLRMFEGSDFPVDTDKL